MQVGVVGAGLGGLAAAAHLVGAGHEVTVYERGAAPGGLASSQRVDGFRLDLGPTVLTMPEVLARAFAAAGADLDSELRLTRLDPIYRAVFADGSEFAVRAGREATADEVRSFAGPAAVAGFESLVDWLTELYRIEMPHFIDAQFDSVADLARRWRPLLRLARHGGFQRLDHAVAAHLTDPRLQQVFSFQSMYAGVTPQRALALYAVITYLDTVAGVWAVEGGATAIAESLARVLRRRGVRIVYDTPVSRITRDGSGAVTGLELSGDRTVRHDAVVVNADVGTAYRSLLRLSPPVTLRAPRYSPSCVIWSAGVRGALADGVTTHNVHFGHDWSGSIEALDRGERMTDPSTLVTVPSLADPTAAPVGGSTLVALEPVPNLDGRVDWVANRDRLGSEFRARLAGWGYPVDDVVVERCHDPLSWREIGLPAGTPFSLAHQFRHTGPLRPRNVDRRVPGLAFVGAGTVPGVGVPMVVMSGRLAAQRIEEYAVATRTVRW